MRRVCLTSWLVITLPFSTAAATAGPLSREGLTAAAPPSLLLRILERDANSSSPFERATPQRRDSGQASTRTPRLPSCRSRKKGALVGAAIGAIAGAAFGLYVARGVSGAVLGSASGARRYVTYWTVGGAGGGALGGLAFCM